MPLYKTPFMQNPKGCGEIKQKFAPKLSLQFPKNSLCLKRAQLSLAG